MLRVEQTERLTAGNTAHASIFKGGCIKSNPTGNLVLRYEKGP